MTLFYYLTTLVDSSVEKPEAFVNVLNFSIKIKIKIQSTYHEFFETLIRKFDIFIYV